MLRTADDRPSYVAEAEWLGGKDAEPLKISMKTGANIKTYKPVMYKLSEQAIVVR